MNGIGTAFIWAAILSGPVLLLLLALVAVERAAAKTLRSMHRKRQRRPSRRSIGARSP